MGKKRKPIFFRSGAQRINEMCRLKKRYDSLKEAAEADTTKRPYLRPICHGWHNTSVTTIQFNPKRRRK